MDAALCWDVASMEPARPTWSSSPQPPAEALAACMPLLTFSRAGSHLANRSRQDLLLSRTVIPLPPECREWGYVGRFACDWHRLVAATLH